MHGHSSSAGGRFLAALPEHVLELVLERGGLLANLGVQQRGQLFVFFFYLR